MERMVSYVRDNFFAGVPGQSGLDPVERLRRHRRTAHLLQFLQQPDPQTRPRQISGCHQAVVPAAHDDDVDVTPAGAQTRSHASA